MVATDWVEVLAAKTSVSRNLGVVAESSIAASATDDIEYALVGEPCSVP
jgi:hypothetical protein